MRRVVQLASLVGAAVAFPDDIVEKFEAFKQKFRPEGYGSAEKELDAMKHFVTNLEGASKMQEADPSAQYSHLTPFADKAAHAVPKGFNTALADHKMLRSKRVFFPSTDGLPDEFDWVAEGAVNEPKNQAQCGSCWAFATVANVEGNYFVQTGELPNLSEQELVDCSESDNGCNGGLPSSAYQDMISDNLGLEAESDYSYDAADETCKADATKEKVFLSDWASVSEDEEEMRAAVKKYGPVAIGINASWMQMYTGGVSDPPFCDPEGLDHGVAIVGWGEEDGKKFWKIRNSWGSEWGEGGYYKIVRGKGACGLNRMVTSAIVKPSKSLTNAQERNSRLFSKN